MSGLPVAGPWRCGDHLSLGRGHRGEAGLQRDQGDQGLQEGGDDHDTGILEIKSGLLESRVIYHQSQSL